MFELGANTLLLILLACLFFLFIFALMFSFAQFIPHFLLATYFLLPLVYNLTGTAPLPLTTVFVLLFGPVALWHSDKRLLASFVVFFIYIVTVILTSMMNDVSMIEHRTAFIPLIIAFVCIISLSGYSAENILPSFTKIIIYWIILNSIFSILQLAFGNSFYLISTTGKAAMVLGVERGYGLIGMATQVGVTFCLGVPLIASLLLSKRRKILLSILFFLSLAGLVSSFSRGAILGTYVALVFLLLFHKKYKLIFLSIMMGLVCYGAYSVVMAFLPENYSHFFQGKDGSATARLPFTLMAFKMFLDRPLTGFGFGGFAEYCVKYGSQIHIEAHNTYAQVLVEFGIFGFILFIFVIATALKGYLSYLKQGKSSLLKVQASGYLAALIAILFDALVHCFEWNLIFWIPVLLGYLMGHLQRSEGRAIQV